MALPKNFGNFTPPQKRSGQNKLQRPSTESRDPVLPPMPPQAIDSHTQSLPQQHLPPNDRHATPEPSVQSWQEPLPQSPPPIYPPQQQPPQRIHTRQETSPQSQSLPQHFETRQQLPTGDQPSQPHSPSVKRGSEQDGNYEVDPRTGKRYKKLPGIKDSSLVRGDARAISKRAGAMGISAMRDAIGEDEDFAKADTFSGGLNALADTFLSHLRVAPDEEEIERLREEKRILAEKSLAQYIETQREWEEKDET